MENIFKNLAHRNIISDTLMSFYDDTNHGNLINNTLKDVLEIFNAGRAYVFIYDVEKDVYRYSYEVCNEGVEPQIDLVGEIPLAETSYFNSFLFESQPYIVNDVELLKEMNYYEYKLLSGQGIKSLIIVPIIHLDVFLGFIGIDMVKEKKAWVDQDISILYILSKIISASIATSIEFNKNKKGVNRSVNQMLLAMKHIYSNIPIGVELYDAEGKILDMNDTNYKIFGVDKDSHIKHLSIYDNPLISDEHKAAFHRGEDYDALIEYDFSKISEYYDSTIRDSVKYISCKTQVVKDEEGKVSNYLNFVTDITQVRKMQQELVLAKNKAEESERLKMNFLANISHEIRTPLNSIVGFSDLLCEDLSTEEREEFIKIIRTNNELLLRLINDILDLSKMESGRFEIKAETFDVVEAIDEFTTTFKERIHESLVIEKEYEVEKCVVTLDRSRFSQLYSNLMSNAIKNTPDGSITVGLNYLDGGIKLSIADTGIGIAKDKKHLLFKRFRKLDDFTQGTGIGLPICKIIAETLGGKIEFESEEGIGSKFWVWLPCVAELVVKTEKYLSTPAAVTKEEHTHSSEATSPSEKSLRLLVAENDEGNYMLLRAILKDHTIYHVTNGIEAVEMTLNGDFDAILMDVHMPLMNGLEATKKIREFNPRIPIIALTDNTFDSDRTSAYEAGCNDFITKPIKKSNIFQSLSKLVK